MKHFTATLVALFFIALAFSYGLPWLSLAGLALYFLTLTLTHTHTRSRTPYPLPAKGPTIQICAISQRALVIPPPSSPRLHAPVTAESEVSA